MRVLHVLAPAAYGGLERIVEALSRGHARLGHAVGVVLCDPHGEQHPLTGLEADGVNVFVVSVSGRQYGRERAAVGRIIAGFRPDLIHTHGYRPDVLIPGVAHRFGVPVVSTVHGFTGGDWKNNLFESVQRWSLRRFDAVVTVAQRLAHVLEASGVPGDRLHVVPNGWGETSVALPGGQARAELQVPSGVLNLGWVGRFGREKGADVLLEALPLLRDIPLHVTFVGDGGELSALRARAAVLGLEERVTFRGAVPNAGRLFRGFDLFVLSSRTEGTPVSLFEAMAADVPVIAAAVGGVPDVVSEREAWLVPPENPAAIAEAIRAALSDPSEANRRAQAAGQRLRLEFGLRTWLERYIEVYSRVCPSITAGNALCRT
jgi:glycosyltransferase involved in cell wall biosynthesis